MEVTSDSMCCSGCIKASYGNPRKVIQTRGSSRRRNNFPWRVEWDCQIAMATTWTSTCNRLKLDCTPLQPKVRAESVNTAAHAAKVDNQLAEVSVCNATYNFLGDTGSDRLPGRVALALPLRCGLCGEIGPRWEPSYDLLQIEGTQNMKRVTIIASSPETATASLVARIFRV